MTTPENLAPLDPAGPLWEQTYTVAPLVLVGTREADGSPDLAPKHLAMPASWHGHFVFVCTPRHNTYSNILREGSYTVTYVQPDQVVLSSLAASPRCGDGEKPIVQHLPTFPAEQAAGDFLDGGYLFLECELLRMVDDLGDNSLVIGRITSARVDPAFLRQDEADANTVLQEHPLLTYIFPDRFAEIRETKGFPFASGFKR